MAVDAWMRMDPGCGYKDAVRDVDGVIDAVKVRGCVWPVRTSGPIVPPCHGQDRWNRMWMRGAVWGCIDEAVYGSRGSWIGAWMLL